MCFSRTCANNYLHLNLPITQGFCKYLSSLECHSHLYLPICFLSCIHCFIVSLHGQAFQRNKPQGEFPSLSPFSSQLTPGHAGYCLVFWISKISCVCCLTQMDSHVMTDCPQATVSCKYADVGCTAKVQCWPDTFLFISSLFVDIR